VNTQTGALAHIPGSPFAAEGTNPVAAAMDREGNYLFVANATSNDVTAYRIQQSSGALTPVAGPFATGQGPTSIGGDLGGFLYVENSFSRTISQFEIDPATGCLLPIASIPFLGAGPMAIVAERSPLNESPVSSQ